MGKQQKKKHKKLKTIIRLITEILIALGTLLLGLAELIKAFR